MLGLWPSVGIRYRSLVVRYSESLADRGLIRCLIYVSLFNVALRTVFCFTKDMWNSGEDNGFHKMERSEDGHRGKKEKHLKSFDLYKWMKLSATEVLEFLFDYIYNLGKEELESDEDIKVKMIFHATEDQWEIPVGAEGIIRKTAGYGATFEGSKVFVHFLKGIRRVDERSRRDSEKGDPKGSGKGSSPRRDQDQKSYKLPVNGVKIPVDPTYLTEKNEKTDDAQEWLWRVAFVKGVVNSMMQHTLRGSSRVDAAHLFFPGIRIEVSCGYIYIYIYIILYYIYIGCRCMCVYCLHSSKDVSTSNVHHSSCRRTYVRTYVRTYLLSMRLYVSKY
ncbi:unnamed protein product [Symbiodinium necroappetens]|uniref:Uncharacterized protein n=1 Tax=Symbiodinium necroappetens TaxID=1628268 RepID=A0A812QAL7_9DINO|nr:unnamed protein product [Symbiodinium necroappetens]